jgi:hypothetical protein
MLGLLDGYCPAARLIAKMYNEVSSADEQPSASPPRIRRAVSSQTGYADTSKKTGQRPGVTKPGAKNPANAAPADEWRFSPSAPRHDLGSTTETPKTR